MASSDTDIKSVKKLDVKGLNEACQNVTDILTTEQNENSKQEKSSDSGVAVQGNNAVGTPIDSPPSKDANSEHNTREGNQDVVNGTVPKKARRVYFHDERLVSGYMDPPNPWHEGTVYSLYLHIYVWNNFQSNGKIQKMLSNNFYT